MITALFLFNSLDLISTVFPQDLFDLPYLVVPNVVHEESKRVQSNLVVIYLFSIVRKPCKYAKPDEACKHAKKDCCLIGYKKCGRDRKYRFAPSWQHIHRRGAEREKHAEDKADYRAEEGEVPDVVLSSAAGVLYLVAQRYG